MFCYLLLCVVIFCYILIDVVIFYDILIYYLYVVCALAYMQLAFLGALAATGPRAPAP